MEAFTKVPEYLLSQCGIVSLLLVAAIVWLAWQLAKTREGWENDRASFMALIDKQNTAYNNLSVSHSKLEGIVLAVQARAQTSLGDGE